MRSRQKCFGAGALLVACTVSAMGQSATRRLEINQSRYQLHRGEPTPIDAPDDTLAFLRDAKSRTITVNGEPSKGLVVGRDRSGAVVVAASARAQAGEYTATVTATSATGEI